MLTVKLCKDDNIRICTISNSPSADPEDQYYDAGGYTDSPRLINEHVEDLSTLTIRTEPEPEPEDMRS